MIADSEPSTWALMFVPLGSYLGYSISLQHSTGTQYKVNIKRAPSFHNWGWVDVVSDRTFSLGKTEEAMEYARELIDADLSSILPY